MLLTLARFEIEAFERARRIALVPEARPPPRSGLRGLHPGDTPPGPLSARDREVVRAPLRHVAAPRSNPRRGRGDWLALAIEANGSSST
jgi:hypothetical protein